MVKVNLITYDSVNPFLKEEYFSGMKLKYIANEDNIIFLEHILKVLSKLSLISKE